VSTADDYDEDVSESIQFNYAWWGQLNLSQGQNVHVSLSALGGLIDFYFLDASGFTEFEYALGHQLRSGFHYYTELSEKDAPSIDKAASIQKDDTYYVVVANFQNVNTVSITGRITATSDGISDSYLVILIEILFAVIVVAVVTLLWKKRKGV